MLKKILLALVFMITATTSVTYAEDDMKTVASKAYVDTQIETKQLKIPAAGQPNVGAGETVMTYTSTGNGQIGERGLYSDISSYDATTDGDKLITASALNATFTNLPTTPTTKLECANQADGCTLWTIVDQTAYAIQLPDGYTRLQYIESTGTQYINTRVVQDVLNFWVDMDVSFANPNERCLFGVSSSSPLYFGRAQGGRFEMNQKYTSLYSGQNKRVNLQWGKDPNSNKMKLSVVVDGQTESLFSQQSGFIRNNNFVVFGNNSGDSIAYILKGKIYFAKIYKNNILVFNGIPVQHNSDNAVGMYDTVSGQFFTNAATSGDDFTPGPPVQ